MMKHGLLLLFGLVQITGTLHANSYLYLPLTPPKATDIVAFTNGLPPAVGGRNDATREQVLRFLRRGRKNLQVESWYALQYPRRKGIENCDGVMVDCQGHFYFWFLYSAKTLMLQTPDGRTALLQIP